MDSILAGKSAVACLGGEVGYHHGEAVPDPYRWLERGDDPETAAWVAAQKEGGGGGGGGGGAAGTARSRSPRSASARTAQGWRTLRPCPDPTG